MIRYMRKYRLISYVLIGVIAVVLYLFLSSQQTLAFPWGFLMSLAVFVAANFIVSLAMTRYVDSKTEKLVATFNDSCDPKKLLEEGQQFAAQVFEHTPFETWGSWYLSAYTLALIDQGKRKDAEPYAKAMITSARAAQSPESTFEISVNMYEPIKELLGPEVAQECLNEIESIATANPQLQNNKAMGYVKWVQSVLTAEASADKDTLIELYQGVINDSTAEMRKRVQAADKLAPLYKEAGNPEGEQICYQFIVEAGNTMSCVARAKANLAGK